jgi:hypothetical protein
VVLPEPEQPAMPMTVGWVGVDVTKIVYGVCARFLA